MHKTVVRAGGSMRRRCWWCAWVALATHQPEGCFEPSPSGTSLADQHEVETTFPTQQRQPFQPPPELISQNGLLETTFNVQPTTFNVAGAEVRGYAYQGQFIGPTLRVQPGDTVRVLRNGPRNPPTCTATACSSPPSASLTTCFGS